MTGRRRALALALLACAGCSRIKLGYRFADWYLERRVDKYLDLDGPQSAVAERQVDELLHWHRRDALPRYAAFLRGLADRCEQGPLDPASFDRAFAELDALYRETLRAAIPGLAGLLAEQKGAQIDHFEKQLALEQAELEKDVQKPAEERLHRRADDFAEMLERFVGDLSKAQRSHLEEQLRASKSGPEPWLQNRRAYAGAVVSGMRRGAPSAEIDMLLHGWWLGEGASARPEYLRYSDAFMGEMRRMIFDVLASLDDEQRAHLVETLRGYASDFEDLSRS